MRSTTLLIKKEGGGAMNLEMSKKQNEYIRNATHRLNFKIG